YEEFQFFSNATVWDIRCGVARLTRVPPSIVGLVLNQEIMETCNNAKTISELNLKPMDTFIAYTVSRTRIHSSANLLEENGELTMGARIALSSIFHKWAEVEEDQDEKVLNISLKQYVELFQFCTG